MLERPRVRTQPHVASDEEIERVRQTWRARGFRSTLLPAEQAMHQLPELGRLTPARLRAYVHHPDERVVLYLLRYGSWSPGDRWYVDAGLTARCLEAIRDGEAWNPLLDQLGEFRWDLEHFERWAEHEKVPEEEWPALRSYTFTTRRIAEYLEQAKDDVDFEREILEFGQWTLLQSAAKRQVPVTNEVLEVALAHSRRAFAYLSAFDYEVRLSGEQRERLRKWVHEGVDEVRRSGQSDRSLAPVLHGLARAGRLGPHTIDYILEAAEAVEEGRTYLVQLLTHSTCGVMDREQVARLGEVAWNEDPSIFERIVRLEGADLPFLREVARRISKPRVRERLSERLADAPDAELTSLLARSSAVAVTMNILRYGTGPDFRDAVDQVAPGDAWRTLRMMLPVKPGRADNSLRDGPHEPESLRDAVRRLGYAAHDTSSLGRSRGWSGRLGDERAGDALLIVRIAQGTLFDPRDAQGLLTSPHRLLRQQGILEMGRTGDAGSGVSEHGPRRSGVAPGA